MSVFELGRAVGRPDREDRGLLYCPACGSRTFKLVQQRTERRLMPIHAECSNCEAPMSVIVELVEIDP